MKERPASSWICERGTPLAKPKSKPSSVLIAGRPATRANISRARALRASRSARSVSSRKSAKEASFAAGATRRAMAREFAGDRGGDNIGRLAGAGELAIARAQPHLSLPGNVADCLWQLFLPEQQLAADPSREAITPGRLDQQSTGRAVARLGEAAAFDAGPARMLRRHQTEIGHQLARIGETREVAQLGDQRGGI